jgi:hypothetical protein
MAEFTIDTSRIQPQDQGVRVPAKQPMPVSRGSVFASVPAPRPNERRVPKTEVRNLPAGTPELDVAPVPRTSVYKEPEKVTAESVLPWLK